MENAGSLPCLQEPAIGPYPKPVEFSPHWHLKLNEIIDNKLKKLIYRLFIKEILFSYTCINKITYQWHMSTKYYILLWCWRGTVLQTVKCIQQLILYCVSD